MRTVTLVKLSLVLPLGMLAAPLAATPLDVGAQHFHPDHNPGSSTTKYTSGSHPGIGASVASMTSPWSTGSNFSGTVTSSVYQSAGGGHTFVYSFFIDKDSSTSHSMASSTINGNWNLFNISNAGSDSSGGSPQNGTPAWIANLGTGLGIQFSDFLWGGGLASDTQSAQIWFQTNAPSYKIGSAAMINGGSADAPVYIAAIPLPGAGLMGLAGMGIIAGLRRRR